MIHGLLMGRDFASACLRGAFGEIHSVFDKAVNIETAGHGVESPLLTLLCAGSDVMSATLVTSLRKGSWRDWCKVGNHVVLTKDAVFLDSVPFISGVSGAAVWEPVDPASAEGICKLTYREVAARCKQVDFYISNNGMKQNDFPVMRLSDFDVTRLLGLGDGLTPAGDDYLAGLMMAIHFAQRLYGRDCPHLPTIIQSTRSNMATKTNEISRHFLRYASKGMWGRATERLLLALFGNNDNALRTAVNEKMTYGATSGMDEMKGILFGLRETVALFGEG